MLKRNKLALPALLLIALFLCSLYAMEYLTLFQEGSRLSRDSSIVMGSFVHASDWLSKHLLINEMAIVPSIEVFSVLNPSIGSRLLTFQLIWTNANILFQDRSDLSKMHELAHYFISFIKNNSSIKYVVKDWSDAYAGYLFAALGNQTNLIFKEASVFPFTLSDGWSNKIIVYEIVL